MTTTTGVEWVLVGNRWVLVRQPLTIPRESTTAEAT